MASGWRDLVIEQMRRRFGVERPVVQQGQPVLAGDHLLGQGDRNQTGRHLAMEGNRRADQRPHGGQASAAQKAAPVAMGAAAKHLPIGAHGVVVIAGE